MPTAMRTLRTLAAAVAAGAVVALAGCGTHSPPPLTMHEINVARRFTVYSTYWVGRWFQGIPLTAADFRREYNPQLGLAVYYGDCKTKVSLLGSGGCTLPLEIDTVCYVQHHNDALGPRRNIRIRGVPAVVFDGGKSIELYSDHVLIDVFGDSPARALAAAKRLFPLNGPPELRRFSPQLPPPKFRPDYVPKPQPEKRGPAEPKRRPAKHPTTCPPWGWHATTG
jgi:hypothetical protein